MLDLVAVLFSIPPATIHTHTSHISTLTHRIVGLKHVGSIETGMRADLCLLDDELNLQHTMVAGRLEYSAKTNAPPRTAKSKMCVHL